MKLIELEVHDAERYDYTDVPYSLSLRGRSKYPDAVVKTNRRNISLRIDNLGTKFVVLILDKGKKVGFVDFVRPDNLARGKKLPPDTWTPHSGILRKYTGQGLTSSVYRWFLDAGHNLITGHEQTEASNTMWKSLARSYEWAIVDASGNIIPATEENAIHPKTRVILFGKGSSRFTDKPPYAPLGRS